jgi:hypothetical protein
MGLLRLSGFSGMWPIRDPRALPDNAAVLARNMMDEGGAYLKGARLPSFREERSSATTRTVFRIPLAGANTLVNSFWMEFADENTSVFRGSLVNDQYERFYWASPSEVPKFAPKSTIVAAGAGFMLGVFPPVIAPSSPRLQAAQALTRRAATSPLSSTCITRRASPATLLPQAVTLTARGT